MGDFVDRVLREYDDLNARIFKLKRFIHDLNPQFASLDWYDKHLLRQQLTWMEGYAGTLAARIERFK